MGTLTVCLLYHMQINSHMQTHRHKEAGTKVYLWKVPPEFSEGLASDTFAPLNSWALRSGGYQPRPCLCGPLSCWVLEISYSEGNVLQPRGSQRVSLRATLYRVARWLSLVSSKFPLWPQSRPVVTGIFLEKSNNNIIPLRLLLRQK